MVERCVLARVVVAAAVVDVLVAVCFGRDCPIIACGELYIDIMVEDNCVQQPLFETEESADDNLDVRSNERLLDLLKLVEVSAASAGCIDQGVYAVSQH